MSYGVVLPLFFAVAVVVPRNNGSTKIRKIDQTSKRSRHIGQAERTAYKLRRLTRVR